MKKKAPKQKNWIRYYNDREILDEIIDGFGIKIEQYSDIGYSPSLIYSMRTDSHNRYRYRNSTRSGVQHNEKNPC